MLTPTTIYLRDNHELMCDLGSSYLHALATLVALFLRRAAITRDDLNGGGAHMFSGLRKHSLLIEFADRATPIPPARPRHAISNSQPFYAN